MDKITNLTQESQTPRHFENELRQALIDRVLDPQYLINGSGPIELLDKLKWQLDFNSEKRGSKPNETELEEAICTNLRGLVFERLNSMFGVNSDNASIVFTSETSSNHIQTARIESLKKVTRVMETKKEVISSLAQDPKNESVIDENKAKTINADTTLPDGILVGENDEIIGLMECKCLTTSEVDNLASSPEKIEEFILSLRKELKFLHELTVLRWNNLGISMEIGTDKDGNQHNVGQPPIDENTVVLLRFPADSNTESLIRIGEKIKSSGISVEIQTIPFSSPEVDNIGLELLRSQAARIYYRAHKIPFSKEEIETINRIAHITRNDISADLHDKSGKNTSQVGLEIFENIANSEKD